MIEPRIGVYICHCGHNIAGTVDVVEVAKFASGLPYVVVSRDYQFMCSDSGQNLIKEDIKEHNLNRVVVASCSPLMHEITFRTACRQAGLNQYEFTMANIREHVSWVAIDMASATEKAKAQVSAAVRRAALLEPLETRMVKINPTAMVVGSGVAGIEAALRIAEGGKKVYLVEKKSSIGGNMAYLDKTFPTLDCAACILTPKMVAVKNNPNIEILTYSEVEEVKGFVGNFQVKVRKKARYVDLEKCNACQDCVEVCPVSVPNEFEFGHNDRKAIYRLFPQAVPNTFLIDKQETTPCKATCPIHQDAAGYIALVAKEKYKEAMEVIRRANPLPAVCGRVCFHPCETECRRRLVDEPIAIQQLKRFVYDWCYEHGVGMEIPEIEEEKKEKVAIIGSGPSGLACAYDLRQKGYKVTIFEAFDEPGGMLRTCIPEFRLPRNILDRDIDYIKGMGVEIKTGIKVGEDIDFDKLREDYDAVYIATGAYAGKKMGIPGEDAEGVFDSVEFLIKVNMTAKPKGIVSGNVMIVGGGNSAVDAARVALRLGAKKVDIYYRRTEREMPADEFEVEQARAEGVGLNIMTAPVEILTENGKVKAVRCIRMDMTEPDETGRRRPVPIEGSEYEVDYDYVIMAISQEPDLTAIEGKKGFEITKWNTIDVNSDNMTTGVKGVFAGGDVVRGPASVVEAMCDGKKAAIAIDQYLSGVKEKDIKVDYDANIVKRKEEVDWVEYYKEKARQSRVKMRELEPEVRRKNFDEVLLGFSEDEAIKEAERCLHCGPCVECYECVRVCEPEAIIHDDKDEIIELDVGTIIVATGYKQMDGAEVKQFMYGRHPDVLTALEFERLVNAAGFTEGKIVTSKGKEPESIAILHCIGSRDENYHKYCSSVCCMYALKLAHLVKERTNAEVYQLYIDMRAKGKGYEEFYNRLLREGVRFIRGRAASVTTFYLYPEEKGKIIVRCEDTLLNRIRRIPVDMVVLCMAIEPTEDAQRIANIFNISRSQDGFFLEKHPKLAPVETANDGVFIAGACQGPKDIPDSVAQGGAAGAAALSLIDKGEVEIEGAIAVINEEICSGCRICNNLCPYSAIEFDEEKKVSRVIEALCKGCGTCVSACPSSAITALHFTDEQIIAEIEGVLI